MYKKEISRKKQRFGNDFMPFLEMIVTEIYSMPVLDKKMLCLIIILKHKLRKSLFLPQN